MGYTDIPGQSRAYDVSVTGGLGYAGACLALPLGAGGIRPLPEDTAMTQSTVDALLAPVARISGFVLACLTDASTGMVVASLQADEDISLPAAAAGAADIANVLSLLMAQLALDERLEDALITFSNHLYVIRPVRPEPAPQVLLLVILDRSRANLAMARREIREFCGELAL